MEIKVLVDVKTKLGECPTWDAVRQRLFWVDIVDGRLFCCDEFGGNIRAWEVHKKQVLLLYKKIITAQLLRSKTGYINSTLTQAT